MAKALFGHVGLSADPRLVEEVRLLRRRVKELENELVRVSTTHDALVASVTVADDLRLLTFDDEHALT